MTIDPLHFRRTLRHHHTGVVAVTALEADGAPTGMAVGSSRASRSIRPSSRSPRRRDHVVFVAEVVGAGVRDETRTPLLLRATGLGYGG